MKRRLDGTTDMATNMIIQLFVHSLRTDLEKEGRKGNGKRDNIEF